MPELDISPEKVAWVIVRSREFGAKFASFDLQDATEKHDGAILENEANDPTQRELASFIRALNRDEQANLVALAWIGRGTYSIDEWESALETARRERQETVVSYLLGIPLLADYLEAALDAFGFSVRDLEQSVS
jgi:hypothetical protein